MIIGLGFQARSGKDTVAQHLHTKKAFVQVAFADALKEGARAIFGLTDEQLYGDLKGEVDGFWDDTPRNILQKMGTECMRRGYRDDLWVKCVERVVKRNPDLDFVISDVRFPNEAAAVKEWGGVLVRIDRPADSELSDAAKLHASETSMVDFDGWDHVIDNSGGLVDLYTEVEDLMQELGWRPMSIRTA
jgi:hypothetical protein